MDAKRAIACAVAIAQQSQNIAYPSRASAQHIRSVIAGLLAHVQFQESNIAGLKNAVIEGEKEMELYRARWLSCVTPEEAKRLRDRIKQLEGAAP